MRAPTPPATTQPPRAGPWTRPGLGCALIAAAAIAQGAAQAREPVARHPGAEHGAGDLATRLAALRLERLRTALERAVPAPRVAAVVDKLLPPDVQVVVVRQAPEGLGAVHAGVFLSGYEHVQTQRRERHVLSGRRGLMVLDARLESAAPAETIAYALARQYAHLRLEPGHSEAQAGAFARQLLAAAGLWSHGASRGAAELVAASLPAQSPTQVGGPLAPALPGPARARAFAETLR